MGKYRADYDSAIMEAHKVFKQYLRESGTSWRIIRLGTAIDAVFSTSMAIQHTIKQKTPDLTKKNIVNTINNSVVTYIQLEKGVAGAQIDIGVDEALQLYEKILASASSKAKQISPDETEIIKNLSIDELNTLILGYVKMLKERFFSKEQIRIAEETAFKVQLLQIINYGLFGLIIALKSD